MSGILYSQTAGSQQTQSSDWTTITGLQLTLPPASSDNISASALI